MLLTSNSPFVYSLTANFEGTLATSTCQLSDDDNKKNIPISGLNFNSLQSLGRSNIQYFMLSIIKCPTTAINKTIGITFNIQNTEVNNGINFLKTEGDTNMLLALTNEKGRELEFNKPINVSKVTQSGNGLVNTLTLGVYAQKPFNAELKTGNFSAIATFSLNYY